MGLANFTQIPNGCNGIEDRMSVIWDKGVNTGVITASDFVRATSTQSAKIFNMYPRKGLLAGGSDADVIIFDPLAEKTISAKTHHQAVDFNIFEGMRVKGLTQTTFSAGRLAFHEGVVLSKPGQGRYIARENYGFAYERIPAREAMRKILERPVDRSRKPKKESTEEEQIRALSTELDIARDQIKQLQQQLAHAT
jgi:dihydropyrimidinase